MSESITLLAIDPGPVRTAAIWYVPGEGIIDYGSFENELLLRRMKGDQTLCIPPDHLAIEMVASYGMPVGKDVFETVLWIGRFIQCFDGPYTKVYRKDVKMHLCGSMRAKDGNVRQALIDRFGGVEAVGKKASPGPLYGISRDLWSALAVGVTWMDTNK